MLALSLVACSAFNSTVKDYGGEVSSNGGFAVVKGDYVYFVNGTAAYTEDNAFGKAVKGAIVRVKTADLGKDDAAAEVVVPKIVYTEYRESGSGIFIAGDYVYYPTPSDKKNNKGETKNTETEFWRTKLDGTDSRIIATVADHTTPYRFYEKNGKVYLTVYVSETEDGSSVNYLETYNEDGELIKKSGKVAGYDLGAFGSDKAYYVHTAYNETLKQDESFNEVYRYAFDGSEDVLVFSGASGYADPENGIGTQGATFAIVKNAANALFLSVTFVDTSVETSTVYYAIDHNTVKTSGKDGKSAAKVNYEALTLLNDGDDNAQTVFASGSVYVSKDCVIYNDSSYGIVKYDRNEKDGLSGGLEYLFDDADLKSYTFEYEDGGYMYYSNGGYFYRVDLSDLVDLTSGATKANAEGKVERLTYKTTFTTGEWFNAEIVGDNMLYMRNDTPYYGYVYTVGLKDIETKYGKAAAELTDDEISDYIEELAGTEKADYEAALKKRIGVLTSADKTALEEYFAANFD